MAYQQWLTKSSKPKRVVIVDAGMAGRVAAYELLRAGHAPSLLEGRQRAGGRILTLLGPFSYGLIGEAGAMRIPLAHTLTIAYVEKFRLQTHPFTPSNPNSYCSIGGNILRLLEVSQNANVLGSELVPNERCKTNKVLGEAAIAPMQ